MLSPVQAENVCRICCYYERGISDSQGTRARRRVGRPGKLKTNGKVALARQVFADQSHSIQEICAALGISHATLYRYVKEIEPPT